MAFVQGTETAKLLVKGPRGLSGAPLQLGAGPARFDAEPLFTSVGHDTGGFGAAPRAEWYVLIPRTALDEANPWDTCYQLIREGLGLAGAGSLEFAEPDLAQQWIFRPADEVAIALGSSCSSAIPQDIRFPSDPNPLWYQDSTHAQFADALAQLGQVDASPVVRIAHLDTGFDPEHASLPLHVNLQLQRNFVDPDRPTVAREMPFFREHYWSDQDWRRIDTSWLSESEELALQLDSMTNNTCLVLAIELSDGDVLLFTSDAQVGSWLSWQDLEWHASGRNITGPELLRHTILYKVGHHGSHNATLREKGLELMDRLQVALLPVDHAMAVKKGWDNIPFAPLLEALDRRTHGAVLRTDQPPPGNFGLPLVDNDLFFEVAV